MGFSMFKKEFRASFRKSVERRLSFRNKQKGRRVSFSDEVQVHETYAKDTGFFSEYNRRSIFRKKKPLETQQVLSDIETVRKELFPDGNCFPVSRDTLDVSEHAPIPETKHDPEGDQSDQANHDAGVETTQITILAASCSA
eukprot:comp27003_c0_seq1/m.47132 comp27003_c0_seq1/g.47132  ORF comp27003_c0_seq1/g.47132 comp27003_c0_seq1/m.47132 type:complete len:141 (-) comp27003_c0_seq1:470-892(-)